MKTIRIGKGQSTILWHSSLTYSYFLPALCARRAHCRQLGLWQNVFCSVLLLYSRLLESESKCPHWCGVHKLQRATFVWQVGNNEPQWLSGAMRWDVAREGTAKLYDIGICGTLLCSLPQNTRWSSRRPKPVGVIYMLGHKLSAVIEAKPAVEVS